MKLKSLLAAAAAALTFSATALPAAADQYRGDAWRRGGGDIVVRHDAGVFRFDRNDREYGRLIRYFGFRPGLRYQYTHDCNSYGCDVIVWVPGRARAVDRIHAPFFSNAFRGNRIPGYNRFRHGDRRWS